MQCNNVAHPDTYGNYRDVKYVQIKHHWFWKLSYIFEKFHLTKNMQNLNVLLLEEDYYLMPDTLYTLNKLKQK
jgi:alpha-1,6-mannosyl-glycoprotein beta-1,2-N-acetylglucosaminyltransferase